MKTRMMKRPSRLPSLGAVFIAVALTVSACGDSEGDTDTTPTESETVEDDGIVMPDVVGLTLDVARSDIERAGYEDDFEILGGGTFGPIDESNWEVCSQLPDAGEQIDVEPRLTVDRSCDDGTDETEDAEDVDSDSSDDQDQARPDDEDAEREAVEKQEQEAEAPAPAGATAAEVEAKYLEHLGSPAEGFKAMCDDYYTHWSCFYQGVEGTPSSYLQVNLSTDGGWSDADIQDMADTTGLHWFNFIGCDFPEINTIVVTINGLDHNVLRHDVPNLC